MSEFGKDINVPSRKGVFIPDITVEMLRNASLEGVEDLLASGKMEDISLPSAQTWIPITERLPKVGQDILATVEWSTGDRSLLMHQFTEKTMELDFVVAWMPLPKLYKK